MPEGKETTCNTTTVTTRTDHATVVFQTLEYLISITADQPIPKAS